MLGRWLAGEGERGPRTWATLLEALKEIGNPELAEEIRLEFMSHKVILYLGFQQFSFLLLCFMSFYIPSCLLVGFQRFETNIQ